MKKYYFRKFLPKNNFAVIVFLPTYAFFLYANFYFFVCYFLFFFVCYFLPTTYRYILYANGEFYLFEVGFEQRFNVFSKKSLISYTYIHIIQQMAIQLSILLNFLIFLNRVFFLMIVNAPISENKILHCFYFLIFF